MKTSKELIQFQGLQFNTDATNLTVGPIVMVLTKCGAGQTRNQQQEKNRAAKIVIVMDIITNA